MANAGFKYREIRFVIEDELTQCFVLLDADGYCPPGVQGWHHKTFPGSISVQDILKHVPDAVVWPLDAPK